MVVCVGTVVGEVVTVVPSNVEVVGVAGVVEVDVGTGVDMVLSICQGMRKQRAKRIGRSCIRDGGTGGTSERIGRSCIRDGGTGGTSKH